MKVKHIAKVAALLEDNGFKVMFIRSRFQTLHLEVALSEDLSQEILDAIN